MITIQPRRFVCKKCEHQWEGELLCHVPISVFVAHIKSTYCPNCGAGSDKVCFDLQFEIQELAAAAFSWYGGGDLFERRRSVAE